MAPPDDSIEPFLRIPWTASLLKRPNIVFRIPGSRKFKASTEDSLFAEILKTPRTIRACISFYVRPNSSNDRIEEVTTLLTVGNGMNGHPHYLHGGVIASILDEAMGILQVCNHERDHLSDVGKGLAEGELPPTGYGSFTAYLNTKYLRPVQTPGSLMAVARYIRREGRKDWIYAEIRQRQGATEDHDGDEIVCAMAEGLMIVPRPEKSRL